MQSNLDRYSVRVVLLYMAFAAIFGGAASLFQRGGKVEVAIALSVMYGLFVLFAWLYMGAYRESVFSGITLFMGATLYCFAVTLVIGDMFRPNELMVGKSVSAQALALFMGSGLFATSGVFIWSWPGKRLIRRLF